jgi:hypothetical protein
MPIHSHNWRIAAAIYSFYWDVVKMYLLSFVIGSGESDFMKKRNIE